jgi:hypothetical protein
MLRSLLTVNVLTETLTLIPEELFHAQGLFYVGSFLKEFQG